MTIVIALIEGISDASVVLHFPDEVSAEQAFGILAELGKNRKDTAWAEKAFEESREQVKLKYEILNN